MSIQILTHKPDNVGLKESKTLFLQKITKNQVLEQGLPVTVLEVSLTEQFWMSTASGSLHSGSGTPIANRV